MNYWRQTDIVDIDRVMQQPVTIIGAGAVGSFVALALAKMGAQLIAVYDDDRIEDHNLPNQFYRVRDLGMLKVVALQDIVREYTGTIIEALPVKYEKQELEGVVIVAADNMEARRKIWEQVRYQTKVPLYIDTRMGAEVAIVHAVKPLDVDDVRAYEATLHSSDEAFHARCTEKAIVYTALGLAAITAGKVKKFLMAEPYKKTVVRDFRLSVLQ